MKKILLAILVLTGLSANAQYFHHTYSTGIGLKTTSGLNTNTLGLGHFMVGYNYNDLTAVRTDFNGDISGAPYFDNTYQLTDPSTSAALGTSESKAFEMDNGNGFGIIGVCSDRTVNPNILRLFYMQLNPSGSVTNVFSYVPNSSGSITGISQVRGIAESANGAEVYVTGLAFDATAIKNYAFVIKIDVATGAIAWSQVYDFSISQIVSGGKDIIESPYTPSGQPEAVLIGELYNTSTGFQDVFALRINSTTGNPIANAQVFGTTASQDFFSSISVANGTGGGSNGFIIGGSTNANGNDDFWLLKTDQSCNALWSYTYDYSATSYQDHRCQDVIERKNGSAYEYYAAGHVNTGSPQNYDMTVVKTDDVGIPFTNGEFTYGRTGQELALSIDQYNGTGADGISLFGYTSSFSSTFYDLYIVKAYFNGVSCEGTLDKVRETSGPGLLTTYTASTVDRLASDIAPNHSSFSNSDRNQCFATTVRGGDNGTGGGQGGGSGKLTTPDEKGSQAVVSPNPMQANSPAIAISIEAQNAATAQIAIYDMLGRQYYAGTITLEKGTNTLPIDLSKTNMATGTYTLHISQNNETQKVLLLVK